MGEWISNPIVGVELGRGYPPLPGESASICPESARGAASGEMVLTYSRSGSAILSSFLSASISFSNSLSKLSWSFQLEKSGM